MSDSLQLMLLPQSEEEGGLPEMFFNEQGAWRSFRAPLTGSKKQFRSNLEDHITQTMHALGSDPPAEVQVNGAFSSNFKSAFRSILPDDVRQTITRIADEAFAAGKVPALDIYFQGTAEWIPWELLHDGKGYLGLRFAVSRHPIVQERMDLGVPRNRPVKKVCSYLGKEVLQNGVLDGWKGTFTGFSHTAGWEQRFPPADGAEFPSLDQLDQALDAELIHVTCHGGKKDENGGYWTLDEKGNLKFACQIYPHIVRSMDFRSRPLVFGNACASANGHADAIDALQGFGASFLVAGALNFIGTFAPITKKSGVIFARRFYERLFAGASIGEALTQTKRSFLQENATDPSYLLYCLYGPSDSAYTAA